LQVLNLPMTVRLENRTDDAVAVHRGPLLYSYNVKWNATHSAERPDGQCAGLGEKSNALLLITFLFNDCTK